MPAISLEESGPFPEVEVQADKTLSGPIIGIIYPPPEVRSILNLKKKHQYCSWNNVGKRLA